MAFTIPSIFTAIDKLTRPVQQMAARVNGSLEAMERKYKNLNNVSQKMMVGGVAVGTAIAAPLVLATKKTIAFEDAMADVAKTTGLSGTSLKNLGDSILKYSGQTRTSIQELTQIAAIGGSMGINELNQLEAFTKTADKFNLALGSDFGGVEEAVKSIASLRNLYKETRLLDSANTINKIGSAINELTTKGANAQAINEFSQRIGALPEAFKPTIQETIALGAVLNKAGITAEIASSGFHKVQSLAGGNIGAFAKQMKIGTKEAITLFNTDPSNFVFKLAESLNGLNAIQMTDILKKLKINDKEAKMALGSLGSSYKVFTEFLGISNYEFAKNNSLSAEAAAENATHAAKIAQLKNQFEALAIKVGEIFLPVLDKILTTIQPIIKNVSDWITKNPELASTIGKVALGASALAFAVGGIGAAIQAVLFIASPIGLLALAISAIIATVVVLIAYWDEWGKYARYLAGPLGDIVAAIMAIKGAWKSTKQLFEDYGIVGAIVEIGKSIVKFMLTPVTQLLQLLAKLPDSFGGDWAKNALRGIDTMLAPGLTNSQIKGRSDYEHIMKVMQGDEGKPSAQVLDLKKAQQEYTTASFEKTINNRLSIDINGNPKDFSYKAPAGIPIKLTSNIG